MGQFCSIGPNPSAAPAPAPELPEELVEEILLRFPPSEPASLVRAALVCKQWCRLVSVPRFRSRFREFHRRTPPVAGFLCSSLGRDGVEAARFVPTPSAFRSPLPYLRHCRAIDARHGRVLLMQRPGRGAPWDTETAALVVWNTIPDERTELPVPILWCHVTNRWHRCWNAAVLCATAAGGGGGGCSSDHLDCHRGPFLVVFVHSQCVRNLLTSTYSSETGTWIDRVFPLQPTHYVPISSLPCAHMGNALYFASEASYMALKYDLCLHKPSVIFIPYVHSLDVFPYVLTTTEDDRLRYTVVERSTLYMWSRVEKGPAVDAHWTLNDGWKLDRLIELKMLLLSNAIWALPCIIGFADGAGVLFLKANNVHFTVDLNTRKVKKVSKDITVDKALPCMSFYTTPALGAAFVGEGPSDGGSNE